MIPHLPLLMCADTHLASRHGTAKQDIPIRLIFGKICVRVVMFNPASEQSSRAGETSPVMTDRRQDNSTGGSRVPDVLVFATIKTVEPLGGFQCNPIASPLCHLMFDALGVIETTVLAIGRLPRFAAAEMSRGYRLPIAFVS